MSHQESRGGPKATAWFPLARTIVLPRADPPLPVSAAPLTQGRTTAVVRQAGSYPLGLLIGLTK